MSTNQQIITIILMSLSVILTRVLSFLLFNSKKNTPHFVSFLGKYLPSAVFGMLVIYCLKDTQWSNYSQPLAYVLGIVSCVLLHLWRRNMLLTIAGGTLFYMVVIRFL